MLFLLATLIDAAHATDRSIRVVTTFWEVSAVIPEPTVPAGTYDGRPCWVRLSAHGGVLRASPSNCPPELMGAGALWASHWQMSSSGRITTPEVLDVGFRPQKTGVGVELFVLPLAANLRVVAPPADVLRVYSGKQCGRGPPMSGGGAMGVPMCRVTVRVDERGVASLAEQDECTQSAAELTALLAPELVRVCPWISEGSPTPYSYLLTPVSADAGVRESEIKIRSEFPALPD